MGRKRTGGSEMRVGDVWELPNGSSRLWVVTRQTWDGDTFGARLEGQFAGREERLSHDRFSGYNWRLVQESALFERTG